MKIRLQIVHIEIHQKSKEKKIVHIIHKVLRENNKTFELFFFKYRSISKYIQTENQEKD